MSDFLLELRSEEIPARMQAGARADLERLFSAEMGAAGVAVGAVTVWSTPRRLVLIAKGLPDATEAVSEEAKGPPEGAPDAAIDGFCRKAGVSRDQLEVRDVKGRPTYFAVIDKPGRATRDVLAEAIPAIVRAFPWPKSMRWGEASLSTESLRWVRPLSGIVAILGKDLVECEVGGVASGYSTMGHRFHHSGEITIGGAHDYAGKLRACHVIVDHAERQELIRSGAAKAAAHAGLTLVEDEGLVIENAGLTEWPVPLLGRFDETYLDVPPEVIQLTARTNQKYFVLQESPPSGEVAARSADGGGAEREAPSDPSARADGPPPPEGESLKLANAFVCTANIEAADGGAAIVDGNRKVLAARLSDARFFWEQDRKTPLAEHAKKLERITFHEKLGTVADKVERVAKLARWLVEEGIVGGSSHTSVSIAVRPEPVEGLPFSSNAAPEEKSSASTSSARTEVGQAQLANMAEQAARLAKADLVTEMVGEFPELQGLMGGYYARAEGLPDAVADAIRDHYKPVGQGDDVPTAPVTVAVSLADKLDTLVGFFAINEKPTGSKDPFALRRSALGVVRLLLVNDLRLGLRSAIALPISRVAARAIVHETQDVTSELVRALTKTSSDVDKVMAVLENQIDELKASSPTLDKSAKIVQMAFEGGPDLLDFFADRLKVQQREAGVRHDLIDAVFALGGEDDLVRLLARVHALQAFMGSEDGANLLAGYKRAANILKKEGWGSSSAVTPAQAGVQPDKNASRSDSSLSLDSRLRGNDEIRAEDAGGIPRTGEEDPLALVDDPDLAPVIKAKLDERKNKSLSYTPEPAEEALIAALDSAEPRAAQAVEAEDFAAAMAALASLRAPIDRFFEEVTVNDEDPDKRAARLGLLARFRDAVHRVADFERIEG